MTNTHTPLRNTEVEEIQDINVITHFPKELSDEMVVLVRRIAYLKTKVQNVNESQYEVLRDVSTFDDFITNLFLTKNTTISDYFRTTDPYNPLIWSPDKDDEDDNETEVDDSYEVVKKKRKKNK